PQPLFLRSCCTMGFCTKLKDRRVDALPFFNVQVTSSSSQFQHYRTVKLAYSVPEQVLEELLLYVTPYYQFRDKFVLIKYGVSPVCKQPGSLRRKEVNRTAPLCTHVTFRKVFSITIRKTSPYPFRLTGINCHFSAIVDAF